VRAIVVLRHGSDDARVRLQALTPAHAVITLAALTYANYLLDTPMRSHELTQLGELVRSVPIFAVTPSQGRDGLARLCDAIVRDAATGTALLA
jgi:hypothetical protein